MDLTLETKKTLVRVRSENLELEWPASWGKLTLDGANARAEIHLRFDHMRVVGMRKDEAVDEAALTAQDRQAIANAITAATGVKKPDDVIIVHALVHNAKTGAGMIDERATATFEVTLPTGSAVFHGNVEIDMSGSSMGARGTVLVELTPLSISPIESVRNPGASFKIAGKIQVIFRARFSQHVS